MTTICKSSKLANVLYDVRGPIVEAAQQMEDEGQKIIKLNIGNMAPFGLLPPDEIVQDMIRNLPLSAGYSDSKGIFSARKAVVHYTQQQGVPGHGRLRQRERKHYQQLCTGGDCRERASDGLYQPDVRYPERYCDRYSVCERSDVRR